MAISFVASTRSPTSFPGATNNTSTCSIAKPTGTTTDDLMVAFIATGQADITPPSGWTLLESVNNNTQNMVNDVYYKFAAAGEGSSYSFTDNSGDTTPLCGMILTYRGVDRTNPINTYANSQTNGTDTVSDPGVTTTSFPCWILHYRVGKTSTVASEGVFAITGGTLDQRTSNRGNSTQYFAECADSGGSVNPGAQSGFSFNSTPVLTGSIERTVAIQAATKFGTETGSAVDTATVRATAVAADTGSFADTASLGFPAADTASGADVATLGVPASDSAGIDDNAASVIKNGVTFKFGTDNIASVDYAQPYLQATDTVTVATETAIVGIQGALTSGHRIVDISDDPGGITIIE